MNKHTYQIIAEYRGGLEGQGQIKALGFESVYSAPKELRGLGVGTNPEELLASAAATCYLITLGAIMKFQGLAVIGLKNRTELDVESAEKLSITAIRHFPQIFVQKGSLVDSLAKINAAVTRAEKACIIAQALNASVSVSVETEIVEVA